MPPVQHKSRHFNPIPGIRRDDGNGYGLEPLATPLNSNPIIKNNTSEVNMNPFPDHELGNTPTFQTSRLILRPIALEDAPQILALRGDPDNFKYVDFTPYADLARANKFIRGVLEDMLKKEVHFWAVCPKETNSLIGTICLWQYDEAPSRAEIGYEIMRAWQGKGMAGEALAEIIHFGIEVLNLSQLLAITHRENAPSVALLNRFGFHRVGKMLDLDPMCGETEFMDLYTLVSQHAYPNK